MSEFKCEVVRVKIEEHPNADAIEIARVGDFQSVVRKGQLRDGDLAVYIPEQAVLPEWMLKEMGLWDDAKQKGGLAGSLGNRVKAIKLRGVLSQGLIYPGNCGDDGIPNALVVTTKDKCPEGQSGALSFVEGADASEWLGIKKYEPAIPSHMRARIIGVDHANTHKYDFDNLKKTPTLFEDGEMVVITEKIHGTNIQVGVVPSSAANERYYKSRVFVTSKGMGGNGFVLDHTDETNLYAQAAFKHGLMDKMLEVFGGLADFAGKPVLAFGEVFGVTNNGKDVQTGFKYGGDTLNLRLFDICRGNRGTEKFMQFDDFIEACDALGVDPVPVLYVGPYSKEVVQQHTDGVTTIGCSHIREGVVVKSLGEVRHPKYGRKIAKSVSEAYLLRKAPKGEELTEYN